MTSIYVGGSFDLFHWGHVELLRKAKELADTVIVAVNSDAFYRFYRHEDPVMHDLERVRVVAACRYVDTAFLMESHDRQRPTLAYLEPTYILHGDDWVGDSLLTQLGIDTDFLTEHHIQMQYLPYTAGISSGEIKRRLRA